MLVRCSDGTFNVLMGTLFLKEKMVQRDSTGLFMFGYQSYLQVPVLSLSRTMSDI